jgi:hypothetical protein
LTDNETGTFVNAKEDLADPDVSVMDSGNSTDDEEGNVLMSDQDDDSNACGASVRTDTYVWEDVVKLYWTREIHSSTTAFFSKEFVKTVAETMLSNINILRETYFLKQWCPNFFSLLNTWTSRCCLQNTMKSLLLYAII